MKKIMFSDEYHLTNAVLEGRKIQTRRVIPKSTMGKVMKFQDEYFDKTFDRLEGVELLNHYFFTEKLGKLPYKVGEVVAVAQSLKDAWDEYQRRWESYNDPDNWRTPDAIIGDSAQETAAWSNKMFVKADIMPHQIRITRLWIERLQDISDEDCIKEGIFFQEYDRCYQPCVYDFGGNKGDGFNTAREAYASLIDKVSGKGGVWDSNPYVFAYEFKLIK